MTFFVQRVQTGWSMPTAMQGSKIHDCDEVSFRGSREHETATTSCLVMALRGLVQIGPVVRQGNLGNDKRTTLARPIPACMQALPSCKARHMVNERIARWRFKHKLLLWRGLRAQSYQGPRHEVCAVRLPARPCQLVLALQKTRQRWPIRSWTHAQRLRWKYQTCS